MTSFSVLRKISPLLRSEGSLTLLCRNANHISHDILEKQRISPLNRNREKINKEEKIPTKVNLDEINQYRTLYPEFLPNPEWQYRDRIAEQLEREDMYKRRRNIEIPEFYVGSILAVTVADKYAAGKSSRFVGICISRSEHGMRHSFILRNVIDNQGIEVMYNMYNPLLQKIEVLRLEKRLDDELFYLRDCALEYSHVPQDLEAQQIHKGMVVPVNETKVVLGPRPWSQRWERHDLKGVEPYTGWKNDKVKEKNLRKAQHPQVTKLWEKDDIVKHYRESINPVETAEIYQEVQKNKKGWEKKKK